MYSYSSKLCTLVSEQNYWTFISILYVICSVFMFSLVPILFSNTLKLEIILGLLCSLNGVETSDVKDFLLCSFKMVPVFPVHFSKNMII